MPVVWTVGTVWEPQGSKSIWCRTVSSLAQFISHIIEPGGHHALADAEVCRKVVLAMAEGAR